MMNRLKRLLFLLPAAAAISACLGAGDTAAPRSAWVKNPAPVLRPGIISGAPGDYYSLSDCCVIRYAGTYKMWYTGSGPQNQTENHARICYAESPDGLVWTKYAGNPVIDVTPGAWDQYAIETISVLIDESAPAAERYKAWYCGKTGSVPGQPGYDIGYATSPDGIAWTKHPGNPVLARGAASDWDNGFIEGPSVIYDAGVYRMWYAAYDAAADGQASDGKVCIGCAASPDGIVWTKHPGNPVLSTGTAGAWDSKTAQDPCVIRAADGFHMWYGGADYTFAHYGQQTGYAFSADGRVWTKSTANPVLERGAAGAWDANTASFPSVWLDGTVLKMWYTGKDQDLPAALPYYWDLGCAERPAPGGRPGE